MVTVHKAKSKKNRFSAETIPRNTVFCKVSVNSFLYRKPDTILKCLNFSLVCYYRTQVGVCLALTWSRHELDLQSLKLLRHLVAIHKLYTIYHTTPHMSYETLKMGAFGGPTLSMITGYNNSFWFELEIKKELPILISMHGRIPYTVIAYIYNTVQQFNFFCSNVQFRFSKKDTGEFRRIFAKSQKTIWDKFSLIFKKSYLWLPK